MAIPEFRNEPFTDFTKPENAKKMEDALAKAIFGQTSLEEVLRVAYE